MNKVILTEVTFEPKAGWTARRSQPAFSSVREQQEQKEWTGVWEEKKAPVREHAEAGKGSRGPSTQGTTGPAGKLNLCSKRLGKTSRVIRQGSEM